MARVPRYQEIADDLRHRLVDGEFPVGTALPGISALQQHYGVAGLGTIRQAQAVLREQGIIEARQGQGTFVVALPEPDDNVDLRQVVAELQHALDAAQAGLTRVARRLDRG